MKVRASTTAYVCLTVLVLAWCTAGACLADASLAPPTAGLNFSGMMAGSAGAPAQIGSAFQLGSLTMSNLMFSASTLDKGTQNLMMDGAPQQQAVVPPTEADQVLVNGSSIQMGQVGLKFNVQDVGKDFHVSTNMAQQGLASSDVLNQLAKEHGIKRTGIELGFGQGASSALNGLRMNQISDASGNVSVQALGFSSGSFGFSMTDTKVDRGFARLGDLSTDDRKQMALRIRQEFDSNAQATSVTNDDLNHIASETGISRQNFLGNMKLGDSIAGFQMLNIGNESGGIMRNTISFQGKDYHISGLVQSIDSNFNALGTLAPVEKAAFGNETGLSRSGLMGEFKIGQGLHLTTSTSNVTDQSSGAGLSKYTLALAGNGFSAGMRYVDINPGFARLGDLADSDKANMVPELGMKRWDFTTHFTVGQDLSLDNYYYDAKHSSMDLFRNQLRNSLLYNPAHGPKLSMTVDEVDSGATENPMKFEHETMSFSDVMGSISVNSAEDRTAGVDQTGANTLQDTRTAHFATDPSAQTSLVGDLKDACDQTGAFDDLRTLKAATNLSPSVQLTSASTQEFTNLHQEVDRNIGVQDKSLLGLSMGFKVGRTTLDGGAAGSMYELTIGAPKPCDCGMFKQFKWGLKYGEVINCGNVQSETQSMRIETLTLNHKLMLEYDTTVLNSVTQPSTLSFAITGDPNPTNRLHYGFSYQSVTRTLTQDTAMVRQFNADWAMDSDTKFLYSFAAYDQPSYASLDPCGFERYKVSRAFTKDLAGNVSWEANRNYYAGWTKTSLRFGLSGKTPEINAVDVSYGFDSYFGAGLTNGSAHSIRVKYDSRISKENIIGLSANYLIWTGARPDGWTGDDAYFLASVTNIFD